MIYYMKKEWKKPLLTVVVRGSAEENVLGACKIGVGDFGLGISNTNGGCTYPQIDQGGTDIDSCASCNSISWS